MAIVLHECEAAADVDVGAVEELAHLLPDLNHVARVLDAVDQLMLVGESVKFGFRHAGMLAELFDVGCVMRPLDFQRLFAARSVEGQCIEVFAFDAAMIWLSAKRPCQPVA